MRVFIFFNLVSLCFLGAGCFEDVGSGVDEFAGGIFRIDAKAEADVAEIKAVGKLESDISRGDGFLEIAGRAGLSRGGQLCLIETSLSKLRDENMRVEVLLRIINNIDFCKAAKRRILGKTSMLESKESRAAIIEAINVRMVGVKTDIEPRAGKIESTLKLLNKRFSPQRN